MSAFRWLTAEARTFSNLSADYSDYRSLDNSVHLVDGEAGPNSIPRNEEERVQMVIHFHAMITHGRTMAADVVRMLEKFPFLVNDEQYLDERKSDQSRVRGVSPLRNALLYKNYDIAEALVEMGANLNVLMDHAGNQMTLLSYSCAHGQIKLVRAILERNQRNVDATKKKEGASRVGGRSDRFGMLRKAAARASIESSSLAIGTGGSPSGNDRDGIDVNERDRNGNFALLWACLFGHHNVAKVLLEYQNEVDKALTPPMFLSLSQQTPPTTSSPQVSSPVGLDMSPSSSHTSLPVSAPGATRQDKHLVDVHARNNFGWNALTCCCYTGDYELVMDLIGLGVDHSKEDELGRSPLYICCQQGHKDLALALIVLGADLSVRCALKQGHLGLLDVAIANGHSGIAMLLMERGCAVEALGEATGRSPLFLAAGCGLLNVAEEIIRRIGSMSKSFKLPKSSLAAEGGVPTTNPRVQAAVNQSDFSGTTPLHAAVASASVSMVSLLLKHGAVLTARKHDKESALHVACRRSISAGPVVVFLLQELGRRLREKLSTHKASSPTRGGGVDGELEVTSLFDFVSIKNEAGQTALHIAAQNPACGAEALQAVCMVLQASGSSLEAIISSLDDKGDTPLHLACRSTSSAPAVALVELACDINLVDSTGRTALQHLLMQAQISRFQRPSSSADTNDISANRNARVAMSSAQLYVALVKAHVATLHSAEEALLVAKTLLASSDEFNIERDGVPAMALWMLRKPSSFVESSGYRATPSRSNSHASSLGSGGSLGEQSKDPWDLEKGASSSLI